jgi:hypothetical protein
MNIQLPNGKKYNLDETLTIEEKIKKVEEITEEWMPVIRANWFSDSIKFFLDSLANYLVWHKEEDGIREDKEVMSRNKTNRLVRGRKDIPFSSLNSEDKALLLGEGGSE